jgi:hypothetical protein
MSDVPGEIEVCVRLNVRDVHRATLLYLVNSRVLAFVIVIFCAGVLNAALNDQFVQLYGFLLAGLFLYGLLPWIQAAVSMRNPVMKFPFCHNFSPLGISTKFHGGSLSLDWSNIKKAVENERYIAFYGKRGAPALIPKAQLREGQLASVREVLKLNLHDKAKLNLPN